MSKINKIYEERLTIKLVNLMLAKKNFKSRKLILSRKSLVTNFRNKK